MCASLINGVYSRSEEFSPCDFLPKSKLFSFRMDPLSFESVEYCLLDKMADKHEGVSIQLKILSIKVIGYTLRGSNPPPHFHVCLPSE